MKEGPDFLQVAGVRLESRWIGPPAADAPTLVFLHEGLGSVSLWRDFPERLARRTGCSALVYSRAGYGASDPVPLPRPVRFMHDEAETLAGILEQTGIREAFLVGHSDGASIALICAGNGGAGPAGAGAGGAARLHRARGGWRASPWRGSATARPTCATGWRGTTARTWTWRSGGGTTSG